MKGQSSLELLVTVGVVVAFTIPVLFLLFSVTSVGYEDTARAQADASSRTLSDAVNSVYSQGPGAQRLILLNTPGSTEEVYIYKGEAVVRMRTSSGVYEAAYPVIVDGDLSSIGSKSGLFVVVVENDAGRVRIYDPNE